jgi:phosphotransferase system  glucose/maltose/N-acetylglucosamine-specific IIC component
MIDVQSLKLTILLLIIFAPLAGIITFVITYIEYSHHFPDTRRPFQEAREVAIVTVIVFSILTIAFSLILNRYIYK